MVLEQILKTVAVFTAFLVIAAAGVTILATQPSCTFGDLLCTVTHSDDQGMNLKLTGAFGSDIRLVASNEACGKLNVPVEVTEEGLDATIYCEQPQGLELTLLHTVDNTRTVESGEII